MNSLHILWDNWLRFSGCTSTFHRQPIRMNGIFVRWFLAASFRMASVLSNISIRFACLSSSDFITMKIFFVTMKLRLFFEFLFYFQILRSQNFQCAGIYYSIRVSLPWIICAHNLCMWIYRIMKWNAKKWVQTPESKSSLSKKCKLIAILHAKCAYLQNTSKPNIHKWTFICAMYTDELWIQSVNY